MPCCHGLQSGEWLSPRTSNLHGSTSANACCSSTQLKLNTRYIHAFWEQLQLT